MITQNTNGPTSSEKGFTDDLWPCVCGCVEHDSDTMCGLTGGLEYMGACILLSFVSQCEI